MDNTVLPANYTVSDFLKVGLVQSNRAALTSPLLTDI